MAFNFAEKLAEIKQLRKALPIQVGNIAKNHFVDSFRRQGFTDATLSPWRARTTKNPSDRRNPRKRRAILVDTGAMRRSIRVGRATFSRIEIGAYGIDYAQYHNDKEKARVHRPFIADSQTLDAAIWKKINKEINEIL